MGVGGVGGVDGASAVVGVGGAGGLGGVLGAGGVSRKKGKNTTQVTSKKKEVTTKPATRLRRRSKHILGALAPTALWTRATKP